MIKRVYLPTVMISPRHLHQWAKDGDEQAKADLDKRSAQFNEALQKAEADLDEAFNSGFTYKAQYDSKGQWEEGVTFILHKPDDEPNHSLPNWKYLEDEFGQQG